MARFIDKQKALFLRKQGKSYSQIKSILGISKSTLSCWLRNHPLPKERIRQLRDWSEQRIERYRETMRKKKEARLNKVYTERRRALLPLNKREFFLAGLFLYWGEGSKTHGTRLSISNTDPAMINFFIKWLIESLKVPKEKIKIHLHLYQDMNVAKEINFWSKVIKMPVGQFIKPYIKKTYYKEINHKGSFGHGTCNVVYGNVRLCEKILMSLKVINDKMCESGL